MQKKGNRLLLAYTETFSEALIEKLQRQVPAAEIEITFCLKDSCWEADIIILSSVIINNDQALRKIKEVATQKPVICISEDKNSEEFNKLKQLLPHSKLALIKLNPNMKNALILMTQEEAELKQFFEEIDFALVPKKPQD